MTGRGSRRRCCSRCCGFIRRRSFVSRVLNREREMACDEWVVARTGLPKAYARCLARAAEAADADAPWLDAGARAHRRPPRARAARRSPAGRTRQGAAERLAHRCQRRGVCDGDGVGAIPGCARVRRNCGDRVSDGLRCNRCNGCDGCNGCTRCNGCEWCNRCDGCNRCERCNRCAPPPRPDRTRPRTPCTLCT